MSLPPVINYVDFEVLNEPWNKYKLSDGAILFSRTIVAHIIRTGQYDAFGKPAYFVSSNTLNVVRAPKDLRGNPTQPVPTPEQFASSIVEEVNATPEREDWNHYKCDDGTTISVKAVLTTIQRTSKYDNLGEPIYFVNSQAVVKDDVPKSLWKKSIQT